MAGLAFMMLSILYDVAMRYVFAAPTHWALEVNTFLLALLCTLPAAEVMRSGGQIRVMFLVERLSPAVRARLDGLRHAAGLFFFAIMAWKGALVAFQAWQHNDRMSTSLGTPLVIPYLFLPVGFGLLGLHCLTRLVSATRGGTRRGAEKDGAGQQI
jgi:TRAP-type C4-dicarboxylate transport system permease small subunit